jgi:hypothetical protein
MRWKVVRLFFAQTQKEEDAGGKFIIQRSRVYARLRSFTNSNEFLVQEETQAIPGLGHS